MLRVFLILSLMVFLPLQNFAQVELLKDVFTGDIGSQAFNFKKYKQYIIFSAKINTDYCLYALDTVALNYTKFADSINYQNERLTPEPFVINDGFIYYFKNIGKQNTLFKTDLIITTKICKYNNFYGTLKFAGNKPIIFSNIGVAVIYENINYLQSSIYWLILSYYFLPFYNEYHDINPVSLNNLLFYFDINSNNDSLKVYSTDGISLQPQKIGSIPFSNSDYRARLQSSIYPFESKNETVTTSNNKVLLSINAKNASGLVSHQLWSVNSEHGLNLVKDFHPSSDADSVGFIRRFFHANNKLFFFIESKKTELWVSDGTDLGTVMLKEFEPNEVRNEKFAVAYKNKLFFGGEADGVGGLWYSDGTVAGTSNLTSQLVPSNFSVVADYLIFQDKIGEIYLSNGTGLGTIKTGKNVIDLGIQDLSNFDFEETQSHIFFTKQSDNIGLEPHVLEKSSLLEQLIGNLNLGKDGVFLNPFKEITLKNKQYFFGSRNNATVILELDNLSNDIKIRGEHLNYSLLQDMVGSGNAIYLQTIIPNSGEAQVHYLNTQTNDFKKINLPSKSSDGKLISNFKIFSSKNHLLINEYNSSNLYIYQNQDEWEFNLILPDNQRVTQITSLNDEIFITTNLSNMYAVDLALGHLTHLNFDYAISYREANSIFFKNKNKVYYLSGFYDAQNNLKYGLFQFNRQMTKFDLIKTFSDLSFQANVSFFKYFELDDKIYFNLNENLNQIWELNELDNLRQIAELGQLPLFYVPPLRMEKLNNDLYIRYNLDRFLNRIVKVNLSDLKQTLVQQGLFNDLNNLENFNNAIYYDLVDEGLLKLKRTDGTEKGTFEIPIADSLSIKNQAWMMTKTQERLVFFGHSDTFGFEPFSYKVPVCEGNLNNTIKSGNWNDPNVWSCGSVPSLSHHVFIQNSHKITLPASIIGFAKTIETSPNAVLDIAAGSILQVSP